MSDSSWRRYWVLGRQVSLSVYIGVFGHLRLSALERYEIAFRKRRSTLTPILMLFLPSNVFSFTQRRKRLSCFKRRKERFSCFWRILPDAGVNLIFDFFHFPRFRATHRFGKACFPVNVDPENRSWPISSKGDAWKFIKTAELSFEVRQKGSFLAQKWKSSKSVLLECFIPNLCKKQVPDYLKVLGTCSGAKVIFGGKMTQNGIFSFFAHFWVIFALFLPKTPTATPLSSYSPALSYFVWCYLGVKNAEISVFPGFKAFWLLQGSQNSKMMDFAEGDCGGAKRRHSICPYLPREMSLRSEPILALVRQIVAFTRWNLGKNNATGKASKSAFFVFFGPFWGEKGMSAIWRGRSALALFWMNFLQSNGPFLPQRAYSPASRSEKERFSCFLRIFPDAGPPLNFDFFHFSRFRATHRFGKACFPVNVDPENRFWPISSKSDAWKCFKTAELSFEVASKRVIFGTKLKILKMMCFWVFHPESLQETGTWLSKGT